tara:strand:- start:27 stop:335 length:309 start_codon:yes stop_codon:yes gene_type:complete
MNLWMDLVPEEWFEFKHTINSHPFCTECDLYGEKQWLLEDEYECVMINAPWPMFRNQDRWIWMCLECFHGETESEYYELTMLSEEDYQMEIDNIEQNPHGMG